MAVSELLRIEIACLDGAGYRVIPVELPVGATAAEALVAAGLRLGEATVGVFGRVIAADAPLADGDRLELYLPLQVDPKTARRQRAAAKPKKTGRP
ncbi:MAG TPA: RnfH family protein [Immundisolibacter sp.]